jgi:hypothetical protein
MKTCPRCDSVTRAYATQEVGETIVRYRRCLNPDCGRKFKTTQPREEALLEDKLPHVE